MRHDIKLDSGLTGWRGRLHEVYSSREEFLSYDDVYGIAQRLGSGDPEKLWAENPIIQGGVIPSDLRVHKK